MFEQKAVQEKIHELYPDIKKNGLFMTVKKDPVDRRRQLCSGIWKRTTGARISSWAGRCTDLHGWQHVQPDHHGTGAVYQAVYR